MAGGMSDDQRPKFCNICASDWLGGCATLPPLAEWAYLQISLYNMDKGEPVPAVKLPMIFVRLPDYQAQIDLLLEVGKIHKTSGGGLFVKRALVEYQKAETALSKKKRAGKAGAKKRWESGHLDSSANGTATENGCDTNGIENKIEIETEKDAKASPPIVPPNGDMIFSVPEAELQAFREHRIEIEKPLTKVGEARLIKKLERIWDEHHHPPAAVLQQSIDEVWIGVFPLKDDRQGRSGWDFVRGGS